LFVRAPTLTVPPRFNRTYRVLQEMAMNDRKVRLPELILARLSQGAVPVDGLYWYERQGRSWIDRSGDRKALRAKSGIDRRPHDADTDL
jgi:hypothetical protein